MAMQAISNKGSYNETRVRFEKKGDSLEGYYMGSDTFDLNGDEITKQLFSNDDGETLSLIGGKVLNEDLKQIEKGVRVRVTYGGKQKSKSGRGFHAYTIEFDAEDRLGT